MGTFSLLFFLLFLRLPFFNFTKFKWKLGLLTVEHESPETCFE